MPVMLENSEYIINNILKTMIGKGYSKSDLATNLGWPPSKVSKIFSKNQGLSVDDLISIGMELKVNPALFLVNQAIEIEQENKSIRDIFALANEAKVNYKTFIDTIKDELPGIMSGYLNLDKESTQVYVRIRKKGACRDQIYGFVPYSAPIVIIFDTSAGSLYGQQLSIGYWLKEDLTGIYLAINYNADEGKAANDQETIKMISTNARVFRRWVNLRIRVNDRPVLSKNPDAQTSRYEAGMVYFKYYSFDDIPSEGVLKDDLITYYDLYKKMLAMSVDTYRRVYSIEKTFEADNAINSSVEEQEKTITKRLRPLRCATNAMVREEYLCEIDKSHSTFISARTGKPYITTHFLVPLKAENDFKVSIRAEANVVCLCPNCAAKLEYASDKERQEMLMLLYMKHNEQLKETGIDISLMELFKYYGMS